MSLTKKEINSLISLIQNLYLEDDIPWVVGYSGGKDSTATLQLVWYALSKLSKEQRMRKSVHVISTDTLVESPVVAKWVENSLKQMKKAASEEKNPMPIIPHRLTPDPNDSFWTNLLGRGYPYPRPTMRWCTERMKIKPANSFVKKMVSAYGEVILLLGTRKAESVNRARTMNYYEKKRVRNHLSPNGSMQNELVFSPLANWSDDNVWQFLMQYKNPWGYSNKDLLSMYRGATADGECPLVMSTDTPSCGKSRFGCWVCTLVEQDKSMAAMIMNDSEKEWMLPLLEFRNEIGNIEADRSRRDFRRMTGNLSLHQSRLVHGPYKKEIREAWLRHLLVMQTNINHYGPKEFQDLKLITIEELNAIRKIWLNEKHEFDDSLPRIYSEITGEKFPETIKNGSSFGKIEWDLLSEVCQQLFPEEELLFETTARIINIEQQSLIAKKRYGIFENVEKQLKRGFYKNEEDALAYANDKVNRRKLMGASYNPKAQLELEDDETFFKEDEE